MTKLVRPLRSAFIAFWTSTSVRVSTDDAASSSTRICGSARKSSSVISPTLEQTGR